MKLPVEEILNRIITEHRRLLGENLVGIYLHGSIPMGCFNENSSDIDYIAVVKEKLDFETKRKIIDFLMDLSPYSPEKGIEMSIVLEKDVKEFVYPTPFELHYSKEHNERYLRSSSYICGNSVDEDLAAHIMVINRRGSCIYGKPISETFGEVPKENYIASILYDIEYAHEEIIKSPVYFVLNLCRVLYYLREGAVSSKYEGGEWGKKILPGKYFDLIERAINKYRGNNESMEWDENELKEFSNYMLDEINRSLQVSMGQ
jgi:streptomycin 3"-adenylyltransferase